MFFYFHLNGFEVQPHFFEDIDRNTLIQLDQAQEQMFGADIVVIEPIGLLTCQSQDLLSPWREIVECFFAHDIGLLNGCGDSRCLCHSCQPGCLSTN